jgi:transcriptional regulator with XRE-family HTH domain
VTVADLVVRRREALGLNPHQLAKRAKMSPGHVWKIEHGEYKLPTKATRLKLGRVLGIRDEEFLRAAGMFEDTPDEPENADVLESWVSGAPDPPFDPAVIVAYVEAKPDPKFQAQLARAKARRTPERYTRLCLRIYRAWSSNADLVMDELAAIEME